MHRIVAVLLAIFAASFAFAGMPTLTVDADDGNVALQLSAASIRTTVRGHLARTEFTLTYRNTLDHQVGGDFHFPLPPDAEVSDAYSVVMNREVCSTIESRPSTSCSFGVIAGAVLMTRAPPLPRRP